MRGTNIKNIFFAFLFSFLFFFCQAFAQDSGGIKEEIYSKLKCCPCKDTFSQCVCPEAKEMKAYIEALLEGDTAKDEIYYKIAKKYALNTILDSEVKQELEKRFAAQAGEFSPRLILEPGSFDFGKVSKKKGKISKSFKLYNKGKADLLLSNIRVSCGCVNAVLKIGKDKSPDFGVAGFPSGWQAIIKPQKSAELIVTLDLLSPSMGKGKQPRDVFISSNDPLYPQTVVKVEVEVVE